MSTQCSLAYALQLDQKDPLAAFRDAFYLPDGVLYLDGNSLGLLSREAEAAVWQALHDWKTRAIGGWMEAEPPWFTLAETLAAQTAPLIGADPDEVLVANSTTVNLHQLLATLFNPSHGRTKILADELNFPSDRYAIESHLRLRGLNIRENLVLARSRDGLTLDETEIVAQLTPEVQLAVLPAVLYASGQLLDMAYLTAQARERGVLIGFDCSHSIGAVPHQLSAWDVDFAFWCNYKYLNNGPGGTGGLYLHRRHFDRLPGLAGWFGGRKETQFDLAPTFEPATGAGRLQIGTPNILSMAPLLGSLELIARAGIGRIREKSLRLTAYLMARADSELTGYGFRVGNPREDHRRGGHVALLHPEALRICKALRAAGVVPDYRPPQIVRLAPVALYTSFADCHAAIQRLKRIMAEESYRAYPAARDVVP